MKIGIDIRPLIDKNYSGVSWYTLYLVKAILDNDKDNNYILFYNSFKNLDNRLPKLNYSNVKIVRYKFPNKLLNFCFKFFCFPKIDRYLDIDVLLMPNMNFIAVSEKCRLLLSVHDLSFLRHKEFFSTKMRLWHWFVNIHKLSKKCHKIVAVSESTKRDVVDMLRVSGEKVSVIYSGISNNYKKINHDFTIQEFDKISENEKQSIKMMAGVKKRYNLPDKFILYLGTIEPRKNISSIIKSFEMLRDQGKHKVKLVLAGASGWKSKSIYKNWEKSTYKDDIIFLDYVREKDKISLYNLASLFVFPSFYEGFGFPPLESLLCNTPIITSYSSSLNEVIGEQAILVDPYNFNDIMNGLEKGLNIEYYNNQEGISKLKEEFNWDQVAKKYINIMNS